MSVCLASVPIVTLRLAELTPDNVQAACGIEVKPEQRRFVAPVAESLAEAYVHYGTAWPRLILDDDRVVGFVMGNFDPDNEIDAFRAGIWRLSIAAGEQRRRTADSRSRRSPQRRGGAARSASLSCGYKVMAARKASICAWASLLPERLWVARSSAS